MQTISFKPSRRFIGRVQERCLVGKLKASQFPSLGLIELQATGKLPGFSVFLRGRSPSKISEWQNALLQRLVVEEELLTAVEEGMAQYEDAGGFAESDAKTRQGIQQHGILAYLRLSDVVIDEIRQEILLCLVGWTELMDLDEHGIVIHGDGTRWKFDSGDYLSDYLSGLRSKPAEAGLAERQLAVSTDPSLLYGKWVMDKEATNAAMRKAGGGPKEIRACMANLKACEFEFSKGEFCSTNKYGSTKSHYVGCKIAGSRVEVSLENSLRRPELPRAKHTLEFNFVGGKLHCEGGLVMKRL